MDIKQPSRTDTITILIGLVRVRNSGAVVARITCSCESKREHVV